MSGCGGVISRIVRRRRNVASIDCCICCLGCLRGGWGSIASSLGAGRGIFGGGGIGGGSVGISALWSSAGASGCMAITCSVGMSSG